MGRSRKGLSNTRRWTTGAIALVVGTAVAGIALARPHGHGHKCGESRSLRGLEHRIERLGLEPQVREAVDGVLDQARGERRAFYTEIKAAKEQLHELLAAEDTSLEAVMAQSDAIGALETEAHKAKLRTLLSIRGLLTPEQWQQLHAPKEHGPEQDRSGSESESDS